MKLDVYEMMSENEVKVSPANYSLRICGQSGTGKTPLYSAFARMFNKEYGENSVVLVPLENRYSHIKGLNIIRPLDKKTKRKKDIVETWEDMIQVVNALCDAKLKDPNFPIKRVCIDTTTKLEILAQNEVVNLNFKKNGKLESFNACFGGYGAPHDMAIQITKEQITDKLRKHGYIVDCIVQAKMKSLVDSKTGQEYQIISSDTGEKYDGRCFLQDADISLYIDTTDNVNYIGKKGNKALNHLQVGNKVLILRSDSLYKGCKSPFVNMPEMIDATDFDTAVVEYMNIFKDGMSKENGITDFSTREKEEIDIKNMIDNQNISEIKVQVEQDKVYSKIADFVKYYDNVKRTLDSNTLNQLENYFSQLMASKQKPTIGEAMLEMSIDEIKEIYDQFGFKID